MPPDPDTANPPSDPQRQSRINEIIQRCLQDHAAGKSVDEAQVIGQAPDLMPELRRRLRALGLILAAETTQTISLPTDDAPAAVSEVIPGYDILRQLHHGGQGVVYEAVQKTTKRKVAVKLLLEGPHASRAARKRFEREIELVAQLNHPNIITIFDSGTTPDGRQFYAMDYVRGLPLDGYVREKALSLEETLKLFVTVCSAVQFAHQRGIIHRDLKPSNILVNAAGDPKLLDFGFAKWMAAPVDTIVSLSRQLVGTLRYMSPEHTFGQPERVDTRTDVYSLGVILYELLTGREPYPTSGQMVEVLQHIQETPPTPPSRAWTRDSGIARRATRPRRPGQCPINEELQTIVLKALAKEQQRRYQSVGELARDIEHYLSGEPIEARGDSLVYVLWKQSRRCFRQAPAVVLALLCAIMAPGLIVSMIFWRQAAHERDVAEAAISFLNNDVFQALDPERVGRDVDLRELLDSAAQRVDQRFGQVPLAEASIRQTLGNLYGSLGEDEKALVHLREALRLRRAELSEPHLEVAESQVSLSRVLESQGHCVEAEQCLRDALAVRARLLGERHPLVVATLGQLGAFVSRRGNLELATQLTAKCDALMGPGPVQRKGPIRLQPAPQVVEALPTADPPVAAAAADPLRSSEVLEEPGEDSPEVSAQLLQQADLELPYEAQRQRLREAIEQHGRHHPVVAALLLELADLMTRDGRYGDAEPLLAEALATWSQQHGPEHPRTRAAFGKLEQVWELWGRPERSAPLLAQRLERVLARPDNARVLSDAAWDVAKRPDYEAALYARAEEAARYACTLEPENGAYLNTLGVVQYRLGRYDDALSTLRHSDKLNGDHPADVAFLVMSLQRGGQPDEAGRALQRLQGIMAQGPWSQDPQSLRFMQEAETAVKGHSHARP